jgi:two-component system sensor histidine kinase PilS (NtrC family)
VKDWINDAGPPAFIIRTNGAAVDVQVSLVKLRLENKSEILVFLDDVSKLRQQAQQLKLASLGRLTASIAHEVRNPLGAISHAAQLLKESDVLAEEEKRLTTIITEQSVRVNTIIENVMRISRRDRSVPAVINLNEWLENFMEELKDRFSLDAGDADLRVNGAGIYANMDPDQLYQVMWNICENGVRYARGRPVLAVRCDINPESRRPYIDIIDTGVGIDSRVVDRLFEPFTTTEKKGTGLGLFIARELCEANQASLNLYANTEKGCIFRIYFSRPDRRQGIT